MSLWRGTLTFKVDQWHQSLCIRDASSIPQVLVQLEALAEGDLKVLARLSKELGEGYKAMGLAIVQADENPSFELRAIQAQAARMQDD